MGCQASKPLQRIPRDSLALFKTRSMSRCPDDAHVSATEDKEASPRKLDRRLRPMSASLFPGAPDRVSESAIDGDIEHPLPDVELQRRDPGERYQFREKIGSGGFSKVFAAVDRQTGQLMAVKEMQVRNTPEEWRTIENEIRIMKSLRHPNVVRLYEVYERAPAPVGSPSRTISLVMEYAPEGSVADLLAGGRRFQEKEMASISYHVLSALAYLHARGIVHRDVKPENIFLAQSTRKRALLGDFGFAVQKERNKRLRTMCGSLVYMAPEIFSPEARGPEGYGKECDMWSFGVSLYTMITGQTPFHGQTERQTKALVRRGRLYWPHSFWRNWSPHVQDLLRNLIRQQPGERLTAKEAMQHPWFMNVLFPKFNL